jgi:hypothetical protein
VCIASGGKFLCFAGGREYPKSQSGPHVLNHSASRAFHPHLRCAPQSVREVCEPHTGEEWRRRLFGVGTSCSGNPKQTTLWTFRVILCIRTSTAELRLIQCCEFLGCISCIANVFLLCFAGMRGHARVSSSECFLRYD